MPKGRGFTLIEMILTLTLVAILFGVAVPEARNTLRQRELDQDTRSLVKFLRFAQYYAIENRAAVAVKFDAPTHAYQLLSGNGVSVSEAIPGEWGRPVPLRSEWVAPSEAAVLWYFPDGTTSGGEWTLRQQGRVALIAVTPGLGKVGVRFENKAG